MNKIKASIGTKQGKIVLTILMIAVGAVLIFAAVSGREQNPEKGTADGKSALAALKEIAGESRVETLASFKEAKKSDDPEQFLADNSIYIMDEEAVERFAETYLTGAESTAQASGVTTEALIKEWGYESLDSYKEEAKAEALSFIKKRLAVYEAANKKHITISSGEYEKKLGTYATSFGYNTKEEFVYACEPASIANEMLYDKTVKNLFH